MDTDPRPRASAVPEVEGILDDTTPLVIVFSDVRLPANPRCVEKKEMPGTLWSVPGRELGARKQLLWVTILPH